MSQAIVLERVTKTFGAKAAVLDLDLTVPEGRLCGFIGPNGAGKTTTMRLIMSILFPDRGRVSVLGRSSALEAKDRIGYLPEERGLYRKMRVGAFLEYVARLKGRKDRDLGARVRRWLSRVGLEEAEKKRCEELSKGMQQKIQFLATVIHEPRLLILDEPFSGLDPVSTRELRELVLELHRAGTTILFSTHLMAQAEQICDHVVMIHRGAKVLDESLATLRARYDPRTLMFEPLDQTANVECLRSVSGVRDIRPKDGYHEISLSEDADLTQTVSDIVSRLPPSRLELRRPSLEDIFIEHVSGA